MSGSKPPKTPKDEFPSYEHDKATRPNLPTDEMTDEAKVRDVSLQDYNVSRRKGDGPRLDWERKWKHDQSILHRPLFIQEKIHPGALIQSLKRETTDSNLTLFDNFNGLTEEQYTQWYQHKARWQNRLIYGNALEVCASLADREGLAGQVQMIYFDPPYGIGFKSNFAMVAGKGDTDKSKKSVVADPPLVKAFVDTWTDNVHSYLDAIHKHTRIAHDLLADGGSFFVQIGEENMMRVGMVLDEVFGAKNRVAVISFAKSGATSSKTLSLVADYILWYGKDKKEMQPYQLYEHFSNREELLDMMSRGQCIETPEGGRPLTADEKRNPEKISEDARLFRDMPLTSSGHSDTGRSEPYSWNGRIFPCPAGEHWRVSHEGLGRLAQKGRLIAGETKTALLRWKQYENEIPGRKINNLWSRTMAPSDKRYVVQTADTVVERCLLMSTRPGDLVLDFTCGSGTTAFVAEKWGRRWIAVDASQVAIATARTRLVTSLFDYNAISGTATGKEAEQQLRQNPNRKSVKKQNVAAETQDPSNEFVYRRVSHVSAKVLAYDLEEETPPIYLRDQPVKVSGVTRVCSPFTVESDRPFRYLPVETSASASESEVRDSSPDYYSSHQKIRAETLEKTGIRRLDGSQLEVDQIEDCLVYPITHVAAYREVQETAQPEGKDKRMAIAFAPDDATVSVGFLRHAGKAARQQLGQEVDLLIVCGFAFDPDTTGFTMHLTLPVARVQMNRQFQIEELKLEKAEDNAFVMLGEPDVELTEEGDKLKVEVKGFATFDPASGNAKFGTDKDIYSWSLDTDYDGRSFFARRMHFPGQHNDRQIQKLKKELSKVLDNEAYQAMLSNTSMPFPKPATGQIAVKIITRHGDEMICTLSTG